MIAVTVIIPCGPGHVSLLPRALHSVEQQSIPCAVRHEVDTAQRGPGWLRNKLVSEVNTPFVVFLDADDTLSPHYAAQCLRAWQPGRYVYTDWYCDREVFTAPDCNAWLDKTNHLVTAFIPRWMHMAVGGFDEALPGIEDADYFLKFRRHNFCGLRVPKPLVHYSGDGTRSRDFNRRLDVDEYRLRVSDRYAGGAMGCGCNSSGQVITSGQRLEGDILAIAQYSPRRIAWGGRQYPRNLNKGDQMWVNPQHAIERPDLWTPVEPLGEPADIDALQAMALAALTSAG